MIVKTHYRVYRGEREVKIFKDKHYFKIDENELIHHSSSKPVKTKGFEIGMSISRGKLKVWKRGDEIYFIAEGTDDYHEYSNPLEIDRRGVEVSGFLYHIYRLDGKDIQYFATVEKKSPINSSTIMKPGGS